MTSSDKLSKGTIALYTLAGTTLVTISPKGIPSIEPMIPERTLSLVYYRRATLLK